MAMKVEVDPAFGLATHRATEKTSIEPACSRQIVDWQGQMKRGHCSAPNSSKCQTPDLFAEVLLSCPVLVTLALVHRPRVVAAKRVLDHQP